MAKPFRKPNGKWYLRIRDRHGVWSNEACGARTARDAAALQGERQVQEDRYRMGLDLAPLIDEDATFAGLVSWWMESYLRQKPSYESTVGTIRRHILESPMAALRPREVTPGKIEALLLEKASSLSPSSVNKLRGAIGRAFATAIKFERFHGPNPVLSVAKRREPQRQPNFLTPVEVAQTLPHVPQAWRGLVAMAIAMGLRKGELFSLRRQDIDLDNGFAHVRRSHHRDTTKGGHQDALPIPTDVRPFLIDALKCSQSNLVFPNEQGEQRHAKTNLTRVIQTAMIRAGIVNGYTHKCRRPKCGYKLNTTDGVERRCPTCNMKLWIVAHPRPFRFHDLRHTTASNLVINGARLVSVQQILRHTDIRTTMIYAHVSPEHLRADANRMSLSAHQTGTNDGPDDLAQASHSDPTITAVGNGFAPPLLQRTETALKSEKGDLQKEVKIQMVKVGRGERIRTFGILLPKQARYQAALHPVKEPS
jgi:integrase